MEHIGERYFVHVVGWIDLEVKNQGEKTDVDSDNPEGKESSTIRPSEVKPKSGFKGLGRNGPSDMKLLLTWIRYFELEVI